MLNYNQKYMEFLGKNMQQNIQIVSSGKIKPKLDFSFDEK